jgi:RNA polymerase sigma factor (sigma-70 family)
MNMTANSAGFAGTAVAGDDLDLVHATQNGDVSAFGQLVGRYDRKLLRIAHHVTHNREDSQDAVQESFMKALQHLGEFREHSQFSTWLFRITVNQALMELRKRRTAVNVSLDEAFRADKTTRLLLRRCDSRLPNSWSCFRGRARSQRLYRNCFGRASIVSPSYQEPSDFRAAVRKSA